MNGHARGDSYAMDMCMDMRMERLVHRQASGRARGLDTRADMRIRPQWAATSIRMPVRTHVIILCLACARLVDESAHLGVVTVHQKREQPIQRASEIVRPISRHLADAFPLAITT